jgi:multidrug transporter EmrE-like cation transporter
MNINILIIIASIIALLPLFFIKEYIKSNNKIYIILSLIGYTLLAFLYIQIFRQKEIITSYNLLQVLQILIVTIIGILIYKEKLNIKKSIGITLAVISCYSLM